jgi:c(7)-type cytochrome triheme protein
MVAGLHTQPTGAWRRAAAFVLLALALQATAQAPLPGPGAPALPVPRWVPLAQDGVHDPRGPGITQLQQPGEALAALPPDGAGNQVRWVQALEQGAISPRSNLLPGTEVRLRDQDILIARFGSMPAVRFPHRQHTLWLDCSNCHPAPFKDQLGANRFSMLAILEGEQCGLCHGAVSFPLTECNRCHSVSNAALQAALRASPTPPVPGQPYTVQLPGAAPALLMPGATATRLAAPAPAQDGR